MNRLQDILSVIDNQLWGTWMLIALIGVGILYTVITGAVQIRHFGYIMRATLSDAVRKQSGDREETRGISSFQALCTAVASCVGSGNIVGVSTAVLSGGLGALFWMWVAAFVGMATKYGEIVLGMLYREKNEEGQYVGGPMYYINKGLHAPHLAALCSFFMIIQIIGGNMVQSNTISGVMKDNFGVPTLVTGIILVVLISIIVRGGLKRLARVTEKLVPVMALMYVIGGILIILFRLDKIPEVIASIFVDAFGLRAISGGMAGNMLIAMQRGVSRGLYSNEAGEGSAPVIHSSAMVEHPARQGIMGVMEVFLDTFVLCTITGLVLGVTGILDSGLQGSVLAIYAFASVWEPLRYLVTLSLLLFCTTTLMSQWYFGFVGLNYLFHREVAEKFKYIFPYFCIIGSLAKIEMVWTIQDIALGLLTIPNLIAMAVLYPQVKKITRDFFGK
ncbi:MAG: sodium:alanine symporter family protein [Clostridiales bacterium]|nr:sodium:alanine symporter family protein [Clostridiales bacterium]